MGQVWRCAWLLVAWAAVAAPAALAQSAGPAAGRDSAALAALERRVEDAVVRRDVAVLRDVYAGDFRFKHATGEAEDRDQWLAAVRGARYERRAVDSLDVEVHGEVALVTGRLHVRAEADDPRWREYTVRYARVYARRGGRWRLLTHHSTGLTFGPPGASGGPSQGAGLGHRAPAHSTAPSGSGRHGGAARGPTRVHAPSARAAPKR
jgi:ketosteroid isomerase-like protein